MNKPKVALVAMASKFESGGQRSEEILKGAIQYLEKSGLEVKAYPEIVWDPADAFAAID
jgi:hypothetical protein